MPINEFARLSGRNYKSVHTDMTRLIELGLNGLLSDRRIAVARDTITAEMKLGRVITFSVRRSIRRVGL